MRVLVSYILVLFVLVTNAGCSQSPDIFSSKPSLTSLVTIDDGSVQCELSPKSTQQTSQALIDAGINVISSKCGSTSLVYPAVCGSGNSSFHIHEISTSDLSKATDLGYEDLAELSKSEVSGPYYSNYAEHDCPKTDQVALVDNSEYDQSLQAWQSSSLKMVGNYEYTHSFTSWTGFSYELIITVENSEVHSRSFTSYNSYSASATGEITTTTWQEDQSNLNTNGYDNLTLTMDKIYENCEKDILSKDRLENVVTFTTDAAGLLNGCIYSPIGCMDDCGVGYRVSNIKAIQ